MPNSLKNKFSSLRYKGLITDEEYKALVKKLDGHDREIRNKTFNNIISQLDAEVESSAKFIREYDNSIAQKAYYKGLYNALDIVKRMKEEVGESDKT